MNSVQEIAPSVGRAPHPVELKIASKLQGREGELAVLSNAFARAGCGEGLVLLVSGNSGSGKTSLVRALRGNVLNENGYFIEGKFNQYQRDIPLFAIRQALRQLAGELASAPPVQRQRWKELILEAVGDLGSLLTDLAPELEALLGVQPPVSDISPYEAPHRFAAVLRSFLGVFCQAEHPVVLFVDDWQWADAASLAVLRQLQVNTTLRYLLVIASYRDEEVDASHPLTGVLEDLHRLELPIQRLEVRNLAAAQVKALLADTLHPSVHDLDELAERFQAQTLGNPFFVRVLLEFLHINGDLWFDPSCRAWRWRVEAIAEKTAAGDVVRLFVQTLHRLPAECRELLSLGACIGNRFDLETLSLVSERTPAECQERLAPALAQAIVQRSDGTLKEPWGTSAPAPGRLVFQHDRVQQAAHSLLAPADLPALRLQIGRLLVSQLAPEQLQERLLEVADHLNAGRALIQDDAERLRLVALNIRAGHKARASTAYKAALQFHRIAGECLTEARFAERFWDCHHDLALQLCKEWAETEFLEGERAEAERCIREAVARARTPVEMADALCVLIVHYTLLAKYPQAIDAGRRALAALGIALPEANFEAARDAEIEGVHHHLRGRSVAALRELPLMTDPAMLMATRVLTTMGPPCYRSHPRLWSVLVPKIVGLTLQHGHIPHVGYSHTGFAGLLAWVTNDYSTAREFGELATQLMTEVFQSSSDHSVFCLMMGSSLRHWMEHLSAASRDYTRAWETGMRSGNLQYAAYAIGHNMYCRYFQGVPLAELIEESQRSLDFSRTRTNEWTIDLLEGGLRVFRALADSASPDGAMECASDEDYLRRVTAHQNVQVACIYRVLKASSLLVLGEHDRALVLSDEAETTLDSVATQGLLPWPEHVFTRLLLLAALHRSTSPEYQSERRREIDQILEQLQIWANQCPANYSHKWSLARGEAAWLDGRPTEALRFYELAIEQARSGSFTQWQAFANERAADLCNEVGEGRLAQIYWQDAYGCYHRWGAYGKLRLMEAKLRASLSSGLEQAAEQNRSVDGGRFSDMLNNRLDNCFHSLGAQASGLPDNDERRERARLIDELTQATVNLREEVAERKRVQAELQRHRAQLAKEIVERTAACDRAEKANEALRKSEERFRYVSKATNDAIWDWDLATNSLWWSTGFETLFGYRRAEVEPTIDAWTTRIHPEDREKTISGIHEKIDGNGSNWEAEYRFRRKDGGYAYVLDRGYLIRDETGKVLRMIGGMADLTKHKELESQLLQTQKTEAIGRLAGGVAHDFNNLLTVINGDSEMLMSMLPANDPKQPLLADIHDAGERAANLTRQLLAFSRKQMLSPRVLDLNAVVSSMERILLRVIGEDIQFVTDLEPNLWPVKVDPGQLEQVIINLAVNARDALPTGGRATIKTSNMVIRKGMHEATLGAESGPYVILTVSDTGCGMPPEVVSRLFEPFFTTKELGKGTGLGLATVFGIVKQSNGLIDVRSEVGVGTTFRILLPAVLREGESSSPEVELVRSGSETVLLVEDEDAVRRVVRRVLQTHGYRVLEAKNGREALRQIESQAAPIDLLITDVVMPEMGGHELVKHLRQRPGAPKVLFMSGYTDDAVLRHGAFDATDAFLEKPFKPQELARLVRHLLETDSGISERQVGPQEKGGR